MGYGDCAMTTLIDLLPNGVRRILENWQPAPEPPAAPQIVSEPAGMGYCWHCGYKSFTVYTVWVNIGDSLGERMRPVKLHGHDQCVDQLPAAYRREVTANHAADSYIYDPQVWGKE